MAAKTAGKLAEGTRINEAGRIEIGRGEGLEMGGDNCVLKGGEEIGGGAWGEGAHEVARAGPDAEANKEVELVRGKYSGASLAGEEKAETIEGGCGTVEGRLNGGRDVGIGANGGAKNRVAGGDRGAVTTEEGAGTSLRGEGGVTQSINDAAEGSGGGGAKGWLGEEGAVDGGL